MKKTFSKVSVRHLYYKASHRRTVIANFATCVMIVVVTMVFLEKNWYDKLEAE